MIQERLLRGLKGAVSPNGRQRSATVLILIVMMIVVMKVAWQYSQLLPGMKKIDLSAETKRFASELIFSKMTALAQTTIGLIGAAWALLILSESRVRLTDLWSRLLFVVTNIFFLGSLWAYDEGYDRIASIIFDHGAFDIHAPFVNFSLYWQRILFLLGCLSLVLMILLWRKKS